MMKDIFNYFKNLCQTILLALLVFVVGLCGPAVTRMVVKETKKEVKRQTTKK